MFSIISYALFALLWAAVGIYTICNPPITIVSYACVWIMLVAFYARQTIVLLRMHVKESKKNS
jgi:hypothetical protein